MCMIWLLVLMGWSMRLGWLWPGIVIMCSYSFALELDQELHQRFGFLWLLRLWNVFIRVWVFSFFQAVFGSAPWMKGVWLMPSSPGSLPLVWSLSFFLLGWKKIISCGFQLTLEMTPWRRLRLCQSHPGKVSGHTLLSDGIARVERR